MVRKIWDDMFGGMTKLPHEDEPVSSIRIKDELEERPRFGRTYRAKLPDGRRLLVTARTLYGRSWSGEIDQPGGRWVLFDPERVADKILDPVLVPIVMALCREIFKLDDAFMASKPRRFTDGTGTIWTRV